MQGINRIGGRLILGAALVLATSINDAAAQSTRIDERAAKGFLNAAVQANLRREASLVCRSIQDEVTIFIVGGRTESRKDMSKADYCIYLASAYASAPAHVRFDASYRLKSLEVEADGRSAQVDAEFEETVDMGMGSITMVSQ